MSSQAAVRAGGETSARDGLWLAMALAAVQDAIYALIFLSYMNHYLLDQLETAGGMPGYALAVFGLCKLGVHPVAGRILDRTSPRLVYQMAAAFQVAGLALMLSVGSLAAFFAATCLIAIGAGCAWPLLYDMVARTRPPAEHSRAMGKLTVAGYCATGAGFVAGALIARAAPSQVAFAAGLLVAGSPIVLQGMTVLGGHSEVRQVARRPLELRARFTAVAMLGAVVLVDFAAVSSIAAAYGPYTRRALGLDLVETIGVLAPAGVAALIGLWAAARWSRPERRMAELTWLAAVAAAGTLALWTTSNAVVAAIVALPAAAALGGMGPIIAAAVIEHAGESDRGLVIGTLMAIEGVGAVVGPAATASAIDLGSPGAGFGAIGVMFLGMAALTLVARSHARKAAQGDVLAEHT